jgi:hypothetical protein
MMLMTDYLKLKELKVELLAADGRITWSIFPDKHA